MGFLPSGIGHQDIYRVIVLTVNVCEDLIYIRPFNWFYSLMVEILDRVEVIYENSVNMMKMICVKHQKL